MTIREINQFSEIRYSIRAYLSYLLSRNIQNGMPHPSIEEAKEGLKKIADEVPSVEVLYILDDKGIQIDDNITSKEEFRCGKGEHRSDRAYFYRAIKQKRCILTDPYPSSLTSDLSITASMPVYDEKHKLKFIACLDMSLADALRIARPRTYFSVFTKSVEFMYGLFSLALFFIALALFYHGIESIVANALNLQKMNVKEMFESTIILTLALAIFDLVKTIFEQEVLGRVKIKKQNAVNRTMVKFLGSIIIALAIEALMLVFKFSMTDPEKIKHAVYLLGGVTMLLIGLSVYIYSLKKRK